MFDALSFDDILQEERARVLAEVNHCHGPGKGHPCRTGSKLTAPKPKVKRLWPFGIALTRTPKRTWPKLTTSGQLVR